MGLLDLRVQQVQQEQTLFGTLLANMGLAMHTQLAMLQPTKAKLGIALTLTVAILEILLQKGHTGHYLLPRVQPVLRDQLELRVTLGQPLHQVLPHLAELQTLLQQQLLLTKLRIPQLRV
jgi:hypothetical protein